MKITALAGGVGGAKLVDGLAQVLNPDELTVIVNTGDDFEHFNLSISPDLDTVCYTLAGLANETTGWGREGETWAILDQIKILGGPTWFNLGDKDFATHLERTRRLKSGESLSQVTREFCTRWGIKQNVFPMSDLPVRTMVNTHHYGWLSFQEYFVKYQCEPQISAYRFDHIENAFLPEAAAMALAESDWVIICPSNPFVSIEPILRVNGVLPMLQKKKCLGVSPIVNGKALKGPAAKMFAELGQEASAYNVLQKYNHFLNVFVVNSGDGAEIESRDHWDIMIKEMDTVMLTRNDRKRFASEILDSISTCEVMR